MFGLTNQEGNHGEDVKDYWWYLDALPSSAWLRWRYHYPQAPFPYDELVQENARRSKFEPEYELLDTGVFDDDRYWIVEVHYAKADPTDILMRIVVRNQAPEEATLHVLPTLWFRNEWAVEPGRRQADDDRRGSTASGSWPSTPILGDYTLEVGPAPGRHAARPAVLRERDEPSRASMASRRRRPYPKDGINDHVVSGAATVNPSPDRDEGRRLVRVDGAGRWVGRDPAPAPPDRQARIRRPAEAPTAKRAPTCSGKPFAALMRQREAEADEFYEDLRRDGRDRRGAARSCARRSRACSGASSTTATTWPAGSTATRASRRRRPSARRRRNAAWRHFDAADIMSMPDPWEYPWFAAWDLAFHAVTLAHIDPAFAKYQLLLLCREWFQHPNGALPAYEWSFDDVNPPVHATAALLVWDIDGAVTSTFLKRIFHKLLMNFTWWLNRQDQEGNDLFAGGFLGLDNIGAFDRSHLPAGTELEQSDASAWMFQYCLLDAADRDRAVGRADPAYEDMVTTLPRARRPDRGGDEPERPVGRDRRVLLRRTQARRRLGGPDQGPFDGRAHPAPAVADGPGLVGRPGCAPRQAVRIVPRGHASDRSRPARGRLPRRRSRGARVFMVSVVPPARFTKLMAEMFSEDAFLAPTGLRALSKRHATSHSCSSSAG